MEELASLEYASEEEKDLVNDIKILAGGLSPKAREVFELILSNCTFSEICGQLWISDEMLDEALGEIKRVILRMEMEEYRHLMENRQPFETLLTLIDGFPPEEVKRGGIFLTRSVVRWHEI